RRVAGVVDGGDRFRLRGDRGGGRRRVEVGGVRFDIGEDDSGAEQRGRGGGGDEGHGCGDHLVAGADPDGGVRHVQGGGAGAGRDAVGADAGGERLLELGDHWPGGQPVA